VPESTGETGRFDRHDEGRRRLVGDCGLWLSAPAWIPLLVGKSIAEDSDVADVSEIRLGGGQVLIRFDGGELTQPRHAVQAWINRAVVAVVTYYGRLPLTKVEVVVLPSEDGAVHGNTRTHSGRTTIRVQVGRRVPTAVLSGHWVMAHEFVHLAFPEVPDAHHWIEEGLATYVEPIARAQAGQVTPDDVWRQLVEGLPRGLPQPGDAGLDFTPTWGRTYWGGALFCMLAEIRIREQSANRCGLQDALRAILGAGGSMAQFWTLERALRIGDSATGTLALSSLYSEMRADPVDVDLDALWRRLGVYVDGNELRFDDAAPLASMRIAVTRRPVDARIQGSLSLAGADARGVDTRAVPTE